MTRQIIQFTGDYAELKTLGFAFQRLFAGNYMQWGKGSVSVWKKGQDVTIGLLGDHDAKAYAFLLPLLNTPEFNISSLVEFDCLAFYVHKESGELTTDKTGYQKCFMSYAKAFINANEKGIPASEIKPTPNPWQELLIPLNEFEPIIALHDKGWLKLVQKEG